MFEDATGGFSIMRVMFAFTTVAVIGTWAAVCFLSTPVALVIIPKELITLIIGFGGVKTFQRFAEGKEVADAGTPPPTATP